MEHVVNKIILKKKGTPVSYPAQWANTHYTTMHSTTVAVLYNWIIRCVVREVGIGVESPYGILGAFFTDYLFLQIISETRSWRSAHLVAGHSVLKKKQQKAISGINKHLVHATATGITFYKIRPQQKLEFSEKKLSPNSWAVYYTALVSDAAQYYCHVGFIGGK
jgi:hypothetical protein